MNKSQSTLKNLGTPKVLVSFVCIIALALAASVVTASGSSRGGVTAGPSAPTATDPFLITHVVKATIVALDPDGKSFTVRDLKTEKLRKVKFHDDLVLRAKNKKAFDGRRRLDPADLAAGQIIKMTVRDADGAVLKVRVEKIIET